MSLAKSLATSLFPRPLALFDKINWNARAGDWRRQAASIPVLPDRFALYRHLAQQTQNQAIDYLEFGVFQGESFKYWLTLNEHPQSRFTGFDTFTGLPEQWLEFQVGAFDTGGNLPKVSDPRAHFVKGIFQDTLYGFTGDFAPWPQLIIHIDSDLFSSALFVLAALDRFAAAGTIILFDEFSSLLDEFRAWTEYLTAFRRAATPLGRTASGDQAAFRLTDLP